MCKELSTNPLVIGVTIGNVNQALIDLRSYGLTEQEAVELIGHESEVSIHDYGIIPKEAIAPKLIGTFGIQHSEDAITFAYSFMYRYRIDWDIYVEILNVLLKANLTPEDIARNPEKIGYFSDEVNEIALTIMKEECGKNSVRDKLIAPPDYWEKALIIIKDYDISKILFMCEDPVDKYDCKDYDDEEEDYN